ncbi:MAG TPA: putative N-acetylmannosamine-6-phosphate 2-epimerase [Candidatus Kapabacteria bacterium]|jgi:N-acylglucosamine-6-phosphate 2-epimerase|nr:putative N-acetylmannosamine-6-phosphate 2-epimerase [Candidatus Kapabacteria bacterium]
MSAFKDQIGRGIIVSCQLDETEPLHSPQHCALFAQAAEAGGAVAVRGEGIQNIQEIRATTRIPLIGCTRAAYDDGWMLVTPDMPAVDQLVRLGVDVIALDATTRVRPNGLDGTRFVADVRKRHPEQLILADISTFEEGVRAADVGASAVSTVLCGRTKETYEHSLSVSPNLDLVYRLATTIGIPVLAEGFIWSPADAAQSMESGAYAVVVGGAITRPRVITQLFVSAVDTSVVR